MAKKKKKIGLTVSLSFLAIIALYLLFRSLNDIFSDWLYSNRIFLAIGSGIIVIILIILGYIKIKEIKKGVRNLW